MAGDNHTTVTQFNLLGLTHRPELQLPLFMLFLMIYSLTLVGNLGIVMLIRLSTQLHTPMYFFLTNLSGVDLCCSSVSAPRMLANFLMQNKSVSYSACIAQSFFFGLFLTTEGFLLAVMAYDRYTAICKPLLYTAVMTKRACIGLVASSYIGGFLNALTNTWGLLRLSFCGPNVINHFFCDLPPMMKLACSDTSFNESVLLAFSKVIAIVTLLIVIISYTYIISAILRIRSADGRRKAFSTCASHFTAVTVFYGSVTFSYIQPSSSYSQEQEKISAVFYSLVVPMLNPLIYSLRNKEVKNALRRTRNGRNFLI